MEWNHYDELENNKFAGYALGVGGVIGGVGVFEKRESLAVTLLWKMLP